jgi:acetyltransferase EpsM
MENKVTLYGASGHAKVIIDMLTTSSVIIETIIDDNPKSETILGIEITKTSNYDFSKLEKTIITIGNNKIRKLLSSKLNVTFVNAIHPSAIISKYATINQGTVVMAGAIINPEAKIGAHCIINTGAIVEHDCNVENFVHVSPRAALAGNVWVGEGAHIGIGATIIQGVTIGKWSTIGAGAVIINDVPDYAVVVGNPGKIIKYNQDNE